MSVSFVGLDPKVKPVELPKFDDAEGVPKLILLEPKVNAPPCLTPLVLAKFDPILGAFEGDEEVVEDDVDEKAVSVDFSPSSIVLF